MITTTETTKQYFTTEEIKQQLLDSLYDGMDCYLCDLPWEVFNSELYIENKTDAKQALEQYDIYKAIGKVYTYEKDNYGELYTNLDNPENLANSLYLTLALEYFYNLEIDFEKFDYVDDENIQELIKVIENQ
jgi:hypothetical protein